MQHRGYFAAVISKKLRGTLQGLALHQNVHCHHITLAYQPTPEIYLRYSRLFGRQIRFRIVGVCRDTKGQAALVEGVASEKPHPHITISCAPGVSPVYSNELLADPDRLVFPFDLKGVATVEFIRF